MVPSIQHTLPHLILSITRQRVEYSVSGHTARRGQSGIWTQAQLTPQRILWTTSFIFRSSLPTHLICSKFCSAAALFFSRRDRCREQTDGQGATLPHGSPSRNAAYCPQSDRANQTYGQQNQEAPANGDCARVCISHTEMTDVLSTTSALPAHQAEFSLWQHSFFCHFFIVLKYT